MGRLKLMGSQAIKELANVKMRVIKLEVPGARIGIRNKKLKRISLKCVSYNVISNNFDVQRQ